MSEPIEEPTKLTDEEVISYLRLDPNFFQRHANVLSELNLPHESGAAVSLIERQISILRERNMNMRRRMNELVETAKNNETLFEKTRALTLELLHAEGWHSLNEVLATYVLADFQADFVCCHLARADLQLDHLRGHEGTLPHESYLSGRQPACATLRPEELTKLFPIQEHAAEGSAVIAPLATKSGSACLAIGSLDPAYFSPDMDTLFVSYIAEVLGRVIQRLESQSP
ncbi:MAG: hypothetical protein CMQ49_09840 [Gammaproteobacteria bacterium]|nr:hypothetical protein [Gammaproteobacteria bacterium]|tara:strand:+ start:212 stop:895 length:684 start_codon:yes stop_codon:yes gene_type:complete